jgi:hypothetical protein
MIRMHIPTTRGRALLMLTCVYLTAPMSAGGAPHDVDQRWTIKSTDTEIDVSVVADGIRVERLYDPQSKHEWLREPTTVPLMRRVWDDGRETLTEWRFQDATSEPGAGTLTLRFLNAEPALALKSIWRGRPGHGPVEHWLEIENHTPRTITLSHQDSLTLGGLCPAAPAHLWWIRRGGT